MKRSIKCLTYVSLTLGSQLAFADSKTFTFKYDEDPHITNIIYTYNGNFDTEKKFNMGTINYNISKKKVDIPVTFDSNNNESIAAAFNNLTNGYNGSPQEDQSTSWSTDNNVTAFPQKLLFWFQGDITVFIDHGSNVYTLSNLGIGNSGGNWWVNSQDGKETINSKGNISGFTVSDTASGQQFCFAKTGSDNTIEVSTGSCS